jgi:predicted GNAT superfamily acetyltransferase
MLGVLPPYQDRGVGRLLKLAQRKFVLEQGLDLVRWTFDPLQSRNAHLNIEKLGCIVREYLVNVYGESGSQFNVGLETDRFVPEWWIKSRRARDRIEERRPSPSLNDAAAYAPAIDCFRTSDGWLEARKARTRLRERRVSIEVPDRIDDLKKHDLASAQLWRAQTRAAFLAFFKRGYVVNGLATGLENGRRRCLYLLEKGYRVS